MRYHPAGKYWSPGRAQMFFFNVPRMSPKDPIGSSWGRPDLISLGSLDLTFWDVLK